MTEAKYKRAKVLADKATTITTSIETLEATPPDQLIISMEAKNKGDKSKTVSIYCMDSGNPTDLVVKIHALILEDLIAERVEFKAEFKAL